MYLVISHRDRIVTYNPLSYNNIFLKYKKGGILMLQQQFGQVIKQYRNKLGLSQEKFALSIDMDRTYYASVESGKRNISLCNIAKISKGLGIPISTLFISIENIDTKMKGD